MDFMTILNTFIALIIALLAAYLGMVIEKRIRIKKAIENLNLELQDIYELLHNSDEDSINSGLVFFDTPIWDSVVSTGDIMLILKSDKKYYDDVQKIYWELKCIEKMQAMISIQKVADENDLIDILEETKSDVVSKIKSGWDTDSISE